MSVGYTGPTHYKDDSDQSVCSNRILAGDLPKISEVTDSNRSASEGNEDESTVIRTGGKKILIKEKKDD